MDQHSNLVLSKPLKLTSTIPLPLSGHSRNLFGSVFLYFCNSFKATSENKVQSLKLDGAFNISTHKCLLNRSQMFCMWRRVFSFCRRVDLDLDSTSVSINCRSLDKSLSLWASGSSSLDGSSTSELLDRDHNGKT